MSYLRTNLRTKPDSINIKDTLNYFKEYPIEGAIGTLFAIGLFVGFMLIVYGMTTDKKTRKVSYDTKKLISGAVVLVVSFLGLIGLGYYGHK